MTKIRPNRFLDPIMREVAQRNGLSFTQVQEAVASEFELLKTKIESFDTKTQEGDKNIYLPKFGKFVVTQKKLEYLKNKYKDEAI